MKDYRNPPDYMLDPPVDPEFCEVCEGYSSGFENELCICRERGIYLVANDGRQRMYKWLLDDTKLEDIVSEASILMGKAKSPTCDIILRGTLIFTLKNTFEEDNPHLFR